MFNLLLLSERWISLLEYEMIFLHVPVVVLKAKSPVALQFVFVCSDSVHLSLKVISASSLIVFHQTLNVCLFFSPSVSQFTSTSLILPPLVWVLWPLTSLLLVSVKLDDEEVKRPLPSTSPLHVCVLLCVCKDGFSFISLVSVSPCLCLCYFADLLHLFWVFLSVTVSPMMREEQGNGGGSVLHNFVKSFVPHQCHTLWQVWRHRCVLCFLVQVFPGRLLVDAVQTPFWQTGLELSGSQRRCKIC